MIQVHLCAFAPRLAFLSSRHQRRRSWQYSEIGCGLTSPFLIRRCLIGWSDWTGTLGYGHTNKQTQRSTVELFDHGVTCSSLWLKKLCESKRTDLEGWKNWILTSWRKKRGRTNHMWPLSSSLPPENWCKAASRTEKQTDTVRQTTKMIPKKETTINLIKLSSECMDQTQHWNCIIASQHCNNNSGSWHPQHVGTSVMCAATHLS